MRDTEYCPVLDFLAVVPQETTDDNVSQLESLNEYVDEISVKVDQLEQKLNEVENFYFGSNRKQPPSAEDKDKEKFVPCFKKRQLDVVHREAAAAKRMQELMRQFGTILLQITHHPWAEPFLEPVDVVGLKLHDYYEVIAKPMDFSTIQSKMEEKDGTGYKNVSEMCEDVRLIFKNAMKYNNERHDVHIMAKVLLDKFETKWLQLLPKVDEEEKRRKEEEAEMQHDILLAQEAAQAKIVRKLSFDLDEVHMHLEELREIVLQKCRKMSTIEKKRLGSVIAKLSPEDIDKALEIVAKNDPDFHATGEIVEVDIDAQNESTLWKLKFFVKESLQAQMKTKGIKNNAENNNLNKRKREICCGLRARICLQADDNGLVNMHSCVNELLFL